MQYRGLFQYFKIRQARASSALECGASAVYCLCRLRGAAKQGPVVSSSTLISVHDFLELIELLEISNRATYKHTRTYSGGTTSAKSVCLTFRSRNYFLILAHPVYKM